MVNLNFCASDGPREDILITLLSEWVRCESPSSDAVAVNRMQDLLVRDLADQSAISVERFAGHDGRGDTVVLRAGPANGRSGTLLLGHVDTVHPIGTLERLPLRREGDRLYGPGTYDMKGGVLVGLLGMLAAARGGLTHPVTYLISPDEEVGSPTSRGRIEDLARTADCALVLEPARTGGAAVTARKGVAWYDILVEGVPAHAGTHHADGRSAICAAAALILELEAETDYAAGTTISIGEISGGSARNVVPSTCNFTVDIRVTNSSEADRIAARFAAVKSARPDISLTISGGFNRPPYEKTSDTAALLAKVQAVAAELNMAIADVPMVGGGSDGNFTAALGVPTLDGLGVEGAGAHTLEEHCLISSIAPRVRLIERLICGRLP